MGKFIRWLGRTFGSKKKRCPEEQRCLELVRLMLDEESTPEDNAYVLNHIDKCYQCYDNYDIEKAIREAVKKKNRKAKIPHEVVNEIRNKINLA